MYAIVDIETTGGYAAANGIIEISIQIFDGAGALVSTRKLALLKGTNMFSVGEVLDHKPGIYLIRVVTEEEVFNTRLVRMK